MATNMFARNDFLFLAVFAASVVDGLMELEEDPQSRPGALKKAATVINAIKEGNFHALPRAAFPGAYLHLQTIRETWKQDEIESASRQIAELLAARGSGTHIDTKPLMDLFGRLERRALFYVEEPASEELQVT